ncbi:phage minor head protein [Ascidiaceihabitans sp.]|uniref:phage head morphogenesis protein n=1 Tax=Ascidiaceihabitans sp. TaxID=1872644 RepID=UPI003297BC4D
MADPLAATLSKPFKAQLAAFRLRLGNLVPTSKWDDLVKSQHDSAFMVAGAVKADLLADLAQAVDKAISEGRGFEAFKKDFRSIVEKRGWHGWTGEGTEAGENWRMRTIYRTNLRTSFMAGRHAQLVAGNYKYWVYRHGGAAHPREHHLALDGIALPPDHPFWRTHFPPNGWGCGCYVRGANSLRGIRRVGGDPNKTLPDDWDAIDPRTNAPEGIDRNWDYAPGATVSDTINALRPKLETLPDALSIALIQDWLEASLFAQWLKAPVGNWPLVKISKGAAARIQSEQRVAVLSPQSAAKQLRNHPDLKPEDYLNAQKAVSSADHVVRQDANRLIFVQSPPRETGHVLVVKAVREKGELYVTSFRKLSSREARRDREIASLLRRNTD